MFLLQIRTDGAKCLKAFAFEIWSLNFDGLNLLEKEKAANGLPLTDLLDPIYEGCMNCRKQSRIVKGYGQQPGIDYDDEVFAYAARMEIFDFLQFGSPSQMEDMPKGWM